MTPTNTNPDFTFNLNDDLSPMIDSILTAPGVVKAYAENRETDIGTDRGACCLRNPHRTGGPGGFSVYR